MSRDDAPNLDDMDSSEYYRECIMWLLIGLDIQHIGEFMKRCTPINCQKLGLAYAKGWKDKLNEPR